MDTAEIVKSGVIANRYEILGLMGRGGMSIVYKARHQLMNRVVAVKMLHSRLLEDAASMKRFQKESQAASALSHPNLITVFDFGILPEGIPYLVMDFVEGRSLNEILDEEANLEVERAVSLFTQVCGGLAHAHNKGVLHRDLKPSNIMVTRVEPDSKESAKVVDFGIATFLPDSGQQLEKLTAVGEFCGTASYMSPEHCKGKELDARTDVYSMGCVMYECLVGLPPFIGNNVLDTMQKQIGETAVSFNSIRPDLQIPAELEAIVFKALEKDRDKRQQSFEELRTELVAYFEPGLTDPASANFRPARSTTQPKNLVAEHQKPSLEQPVLASQSTDSASPVTNGAAPNANSSQSDQTDCGLVQDQNCGKPAEGSVINASPKEKGTPRGGNSYREGNGIGYGAGSDAGTARSRSRGSDSSPIPPNESEKRKSPFPIGGDVLVVLLVLGACIVLPMLRGADNSARLSPAESILASQSLMPSTSDSAQPATGSESDDEWKKLNTEAEKAYNSGLYDEAEKLFFKAKDAALKFGDGDRRHIMTLRRVADTYYVQGKDSEGAKIDRKVEEIQGRAGAQSALAAADQSKGKAESKSGVSGTGATPARATANDENPPPVEASTSANPPHLTASPQHSSQATTDRLAELARECHKHGQCATAEQLFVRSVSLAQDVFGINSVEVQARRKDLATFYMSMGEYDKARPLLTEVMATPK